MATNTITPNMGLTNPTPQQEPGPQYATDISGDLVLLDAHDHTSGKGVPVTPAALNLNSDVSFQSNNATNLRSARFISNVATLGGSGDLNCVYDVNGNLYFNNGSGIPVQITLGNVVNVVSTTSYPTVDIANNYSILNTDPYVMIAADPSSNPISVTLPLANSVAIGRLYIVKDLTGHAQTNNITVLASGSDNIDQGVAAIVLKAKLQAVGFVSDGTSNWSVLYWNKYDYLSGEHLTFESGSTILGTPTIDGTAFLNFVGGSLITGTPQTSTASIFNLQGFSSIVGTLSYIPIGVSNSNSPYTIATTSPLPAPAILFLVNTGTAVTINLPPLTGGNTPSGMIIVIKDVTGTAGTHNITLVPNASSADKIEGLAANYLMVGNFGSLTLANCNPTTSKNWAII